MLLAYFLCVCVCVCMCVWYFQHFLNAASWALLIRMFVCLPSALLSVPEGPLHLFLVELPSSFPCSPGFTLLLPSFVLFSLSSDEQQVLQIFSNLILCLWWKPLFYLKTSPKPWRLLLSIKIYSLALWHASLLNCSSALGALMEKNLLAVIFSSICLRL